MDNNIEAVEKLQLLRKLVIKSDKDIEFNIRVIDKAIDFLESSLAIDSWIDMQ
jgi:hypothetical protein